LLADALSVVFSSHGRMTEEIRDVLLYGAVVEAAVCDMAKSLSSFT
jgi:hypothetical protein